MIICAILTLHHHDSSSRVAGVKVNAAVPSGYTVAINTKDVISSNQNAFAFNLTYTKTNRTYNYSISSSGGGTPVTGSGTTTGALQTISGINVSSLPDGLLTLSVTLTDSLGGTGSAVTNKASKLTIANMAAWFDASNTSSITSSGGLVSQWGDLSGNGSHAVEGILKPSVGTRTINSLNAIEFAPGSFQLRLDANLATAIGGSNNSTVFAVGARDDISRVDAFLADQSRYRLLFTPTGAYFRLDPAQTANIAKAPDTNPHILVGQRDGINAYIWYDGGSPGTNAAQADTVLSQPRIAHLDVDYDGAIGELVFFNRKLTHTEINTVGGYLGAKWGVTWTDIP